MSSSAVSGAAYAAAEKLYSEYEFKTKDYSYKKSEVLYSEILLPVNAPKEYYDRETLWNSAEAIEKSWNSQLARNIVAALPNEIPREQLPGLVREFCQKQFVDKGMCCDFSIHDKGDGNPHVHIQLTLRALDENGKWLPKCRKEYDLDENGEKIRLPSGEYKSHRVDTTDWNKKENCDLWRSEWAKIQNIYYEKNNLDIRVDLRSYKKQNIGILPTVHLGPYASILEKKGIESELGNLNRAIEKHNREKISLLEMIESLKSILSEILEKVKKLLENSRREPTLTEILLDYLEIHKSGRSDWGFRLKQNSSIKNLDEVSDAISFMNENNLNTLDEIRTTIDSAEKKEKIRKEMKDLKQVISKLKDISETETIYGKYLKTFFKDGYYKSHKKEIDRYRKAEKYLESHGYTVSTNIEPLTVQYEKLQKEYKSFGDDIPGKDSEKYKELYHISEIISAVLDDMDIQAEDTQTEKKKESVLGKLDSYKEIVRVKSEDEWEIKDNVRVKNPERN